MSELTERLGELATRQFEPQPPRTATAQRLAEAKAEIESLERALAEKDAEIERLNKALADICAESVRRLKRAAEAESTLKNAREKAIEECAKICDGVVRALPIFEPATAQWEHARQAEELANAIRSLLPHPDTGEG